MDCRLCFCVNGRHCNACRPSPPFTIKKEWKGYFLLFLLLKSACSVCLHHKTLFSFFLFFEITLIPTFFLIGKWGYAEKEKAAYSFLIYNGLGSAILLIVIIVLFAQTGTANFEAFKTMIASDNHSLSRFSVPLGLFVALLVAFGIKLPIFPLA